MRKYIILFLMLCSVCWPTTIEIDIGLVPDVHSDTTTPTPSDPFGDAPGKRIPGYGIISVGRAVTQFNASGVDIAVNMGDAVNGGASGDGGARDLNFDRFVDIINGVPATNAALDADLYYLLGHWDLGETGVGADDYAEYFDADGMGSVIPTAGDAPQDAWWPTAVADDTPVAYTILKNGFRIIFLAGINPADVSMGTAGETDVFGGDADAKTQLEWFQKVLDLAEAAEEPVIVFCHQPIVNDLTGQGNGKILGNADAASALESQTIKPIAFGGHVHVNQFVTTQNGVLHISLIGDVWGVDASDTDRFSHAVVNITYDDNATKMRINFRGYGYQESTVFNAIPIARWKLDEPAGTTGENILDSDGNFYPGTPAAATVSVVSPVGHGIVFDGSQWITETDRILLDYPVSLSIWARQASNQTAAILGISQQAAGAAAGRYFELWLDGGKPQMRGKGVVGDTTAPVAASAMSLNEWHLIVGVWSTTNSAELFVDGVLVDTDTTFIIYPVPTSWTIGAKSINNTQSDKFTGDLSDARIFNTALSATSVASLYREGTTGYRHRYGSKKNKGNSRTRGRY